MSGRLKPSSQMILSVSLASRRAAFGSSSASVWSILASTSALPIFPEIALAVGRIDRYQARERERAAGPAERCDVEIPCVHVLREEPGAGLRVDVEPHPDLGEAALGDLGDSPPSLAVVEDQADRQRASVFLADRAVECPPQGVEVSSRLVGDEGRHPTVVLVAQLARDIDVIVQPTSPTVYYCGHRGEPHQTPELTRSHRVGQNRIVRVTTVPQVSATPPDRSGPSWMPFVRYIASADTWRRPKTARVDFPS